MIAAELRLTGRRLRREDEKLFLFCRERAIKKLKLLFSLDHRVRSTAIIIVNTFININ